MFYLFIYSIIYYMDSHSFICTCIIYYFNHSYFIAQCALVSIFPVLLFPLFLFFNQTVKHFELHSICIKGAIKMKFKWLVEHGLKPVDSCWAQTHWTILKEIYTFFFHNVDPSRGLMILMKWNVTDMLSVYPAYLSDLEELAGFIFLVFWIFCLIGTQFTRGPDVLN